MGASVIRWGILGAGRIARAFVRDLRELEDTEAWAIGSREPARAQQFAAEFQLPLAHGSYADLVADPDIDVVYIATPAAFHKEHACLCLEAGKAVLVEKPFATNAAEAQEIADYARVRGLFCMEAMWMRFAPAMRRIVELVQANEIGDLQMISASLGFAHTAADNERLFDPRLGGGALLDMGVYPISLIVRLLGRPISVTAQTIIGVSGVDEHTAALLSFPGGEIALLSTSIRAQQRNDALIIGSQAEIIVHEPLYCPQLLTVRRHEQPNISAGNRGRLAARLRENRFARTLYRRLRQAITKNGGERMGFNNRGHGYQYEAAEVVSCLKNGLLESPIMPLHESVLVLETIDRIRESWPIRSTM